MFCESSESSDSDSISNEEAIDAMIRAGADGQDETNNCVEAQFNALIDAITNLRSNIQTNCLNEEALNTNTNTAIDEFQKKLEVLADSIKTLRESTNFAQWVGNKLRVLAAARVALRYGLRILPAAFNLGKVTRDCIRAQLKTITDAVKALTRC